MDPKVAIKRLYARLEDLEEADARHDAEIAALKGRLGDAPPPPAVAVAVADTDTEAPPAPPRPPMPHARDLARALNARTARVSAPTPAAKAPRS